MLAHFHSEIIPPAAFGAARLAGAFFTAFFFAGAFFAFAFALVLLFAFFRVAMFWILLPCVQENKRE